MSSPSRVYRFACGIKGKKIFTRTQLAKALRASYTEVPACDILRNEGNFKGLLNGRVSRVPNHELQGFSGCKKRGDGRVKVSVKQYTHSAKWNGICGNGDVHPDAPLHDLFIGHPPSIQDSPSYHSKRVCDDVILKVEECYLISPERLTVAYPLGD